MLQVVHVVETVGEYGQKPEPLSYVSLFSLIPGKLTKEVEILKDEEFACGMNKSIDLVGFTAKNGCFSSKNSQSGWSKSDIPTLHVENDSTAGVRQTQVLLDAKHSTRWTVKINAEEISDFTLEGNKHVGLFSFLCFFRFLPDVHN